MYVALPVQEVCIIIEGWEGLNVFKPGTYFVAADVATGMPGVQSYYIMPTYQEVCC